MPRTLTLKLSSALLAVSVGLWACDEDAAAPVEETAKIEEAVAAAAPEEKPEAKLGPDEVCAALVEAAKSGDADSYKAHVTEESATKLEDEAVRTAVVAFWAAADCGEASITEDAASVPLTSGENTRDAGFVKGEETWRHDVVAYLQKYPLEEQAKGKKKAKKSKKRRKK